MSEHFSSGSRISFRLQDKPMKESVTSGIFHSTNVFHLNGNKWMMSYSTLNFPVVNIYHRKLLTLLNLHPLTTVLYAFKFFWNCWCQSFTTPWDSQAHTPCLTRECSSQFLKMRDEAHGLSSKKYILTIFTASNTECEISPGRTCVHLCLVFYVGMCWR